MNDKKKVISLTLTITILVLVIVGISYAWLKITVPGTKKHVLRVGGLNIILTENNSITLSDARPMSDESGMAQEGFSFTVENQGGIDTCYQIYLDDDTIDDTETRLDDQYIKYSLDMNGTTGTATVLSSRKIYSGIIAKGNTDSFVLKVWINDDIDGYITHQIFKAKLRVEAYDECPSLGLASDVLLANNPIQEEKSNMFNYTSNGKYWDTTTNSPSTEANNEYITNGLYSREDEDGTSYYFRGEVDNIVQFGAYQNDYYVYKYSSYEFANLETCQKYNSSCSETNKVLKYTKGTQMYWKIVRINGDGSLRLLYSGTSANATGAEVTIGQSSYNINNNDPKYAGYTYDNGTDSTIKKAIDSWYQISLSGSSYDGKIVNGRFCSDSSNYHNDSNAGYNVFASYDRLEAPIKLGTGSVVPTLICPVTSESYGGSYRLKAGLLTADEMVLGGENYGVTNKNTYLYDGVGKIMYWSMTPGFFYDYGANVWSVLGNFLYAIVDKYRFSARPVINLNTGIRITAGSGTVDDPYIIE